MKTHRRMNHAMNRPTYITLLTALALFPRIYGTAVGEQTNDARLRHFRPSGLVRFATMDQAAAKRNELIHFI